MFLDSIQEDIANVFRRDPAARSHVEVLLCYPGLHALWTHRLANFFYRRGLHLAARVLSHAARFLTGVEIHPGATIGRRFFIDHGMGVVIGETSIIGDDCLMYQGAVLGGTSLAKEKRHPTLGNSVIIGAHSAVLGPITIGDRVRVGSGSVVVQSVPSGSTVVGVPGRIQKRVADGTPELDLQHSNIPDPIAEVFKAMFDLQQRLEWRIDKLENERKD